jgi:hypothetical protein
MRLHSLQNGGAHWHRGCLPAASSAALPTSCWRNPFRASSHTLLGRLRFSTELRRNALGDFQLVELVAQLCPFAIAQQSLMMPQTRLNSLSVWDEIIGQIWRRK